LAMLTPRDRTVWCTRLATSCGLINIGGRTSALLGLLLSAKADIGKACRLTDHFQLACLNLSHGLKWRAGRGRLQWTYHVIPAFVWNALQLERLEFGSYSARPDRANRLRTC
jgi:hypothetical protein